MSRAALARRGHFIRVSDDNTTLLLLTNDSAVRTNSHQMLLVVVRFYATYCWHYTFIRFRKGVGCSCRSAQSRTRLIIKQCHSLIWLFVRSRDFIKSGEI